VWNARLDSPSRSAYPYELGATLAILRRLDVLPVTCTTNHIVEHIRDNLNKSHRSVVVSTAQSIVIIIIILSSAVLRKIFDTHAS